MQVLRTLTLPDCSWLRSGFAFSSASALPQPRLWLCLWLWLWLWLWAALAFALFGLCLPYSSAGEPEGPTGRMVPIDIVTDTDTETGTETHIDRRRRRSLYFHWNCNCHCHWHCHWQLALIGIGIVIDYVIAIGHFHSPASPPLRFGLALSWVVSVTVTVSSLVYNI